MSWYNISVYAVMVLSITLIIGVIFFLYYSLYRYKIQAIEMGLEDEIIKKEYLQSQSTVTKIMDVFSVLFTVVLLVFFVCSLRASKQGNVFKISNKSLHVVASSSMSVKADGNRYLTENNLDNQFDVYDIIVTEAVESSQELSLYDVVVYNKSGNKIVHRIVDIFEKDGTTYYTLRGDANNSDDAKPVSFENIIGKYTNIRIPALGIFVIFLQSALGYVAIGVVFILEMVVPFFEKKIERAILERLTVIGRISKQK